MGVLSNSWGERKNEQPRESREKPEMGKTRGATGQTIRAQERTFLSHERQPEVEFHLFWDALSTFRP